MKHSVDKPHPFSHLSRRVRVCVWLVVCAVLSSLSTASAQETDPLDDYINTLINEEGVESGALEQTVEQLSYLALHPKNINTATREDFEALPFLTDLQVEKLCEYLYRYAPMRSVGELAMIPEIESNTRSLLLRFFYIGDEPQPGWGKLADVLYRGRHELTLTGRVPFYQRKGDKSGYLGPRYSHSLRYTFQSGDRLSAGLVGSNDAGEPFFAGDNSQGYDHYALFVQVKNLCFVKQAVVGHYRIRIGQGLIFNSNFTMGKYLASNTSSSTAVITPHSSRMQSNYLQGAAATFTLDPHWELTSFVSHRGIDATLDKSKESITTLLTTNYHRTLTEISKKNDAKETVVGGHLTYNNRKGIVVGLNAVYNSFDLPLRPNTSQRYRLYYPEGNHFANYSIDYSYRSYRLSLFGETATGSSGSVATLNQLVWRPLGDLQLSVIQRFYGYRYNAVHAEAFNEGGYVKNESGVFVGLQYRLSARWTLKAYTDYAYFPWLKYQASDASRCWDNMVEAVWQKNEVTLSGRYRYKARQKDVKDAADLWWQKDHRCRIVADYPLLSCAMKTQVDFHHYELSAKSNGFMISQQATLKPAKWFSCTLTGAYFNTDDYYSRAYLYEPGPLYTISFPSYYYKGIHWSAFLKAAVNENLFISLRIGTVNYFNRSTISSGLQQIDRSSKTDLDVQLRWKF